MMTMSRPDYLPTHDHFYGYLAGNNGILAPIADAVMSETSIAKDDYPAPETCGEELCKLSVSNTYSTDRAGLFLKYPVQLHQTNGRNTEKVHPPRVEHLEFEQSGEGGWWDVVFNYRRAVYKLKRYWNACGEGKLWLNSDDYNLSLSVSLEDDLSEKVQQIPSQVTSRFSVEEDKIEMEQDPSEIAESIRDCLSRNEWYNQRLHGGACKTFYLEYKVSLEELNVEATIRQVKKRENDGVPVIATFDKRFEKYRSLIENENIQLHIFEDDLRHKIQREFSESVDASLDQFQQGDSS